MAQDRGAACPYTHVTGHEFPAVGFRAVCGEREGTQSEDSLKQQMGSGEQTKPQPLRRLEELG